MRRCTRSHWHRLLDPGLSEYVVGFTLLRSIALCLRHAALLERQAAAAKARGVTVAGGATGKVKLGKTRTGWHGAHMLICLRL